MTRVAIPFVFISLCAGIALPVRAQNAPADTITFKNGDRITGRLVRATGKSISFKSDALGDLTFDWSKVQEVHSPRVFVIIPKGVTLDHKTSAASLQRGPLTVTGSQIQAGPQTTTAAGLDYLVDENEFQAAMTDHNNLFKDWTGAVTAGASLVEATQTSTTFTAGVKLVRATPPESWLPPRDRTIFDFATSYGKLDQPNTPTVKTNLFHLGLERDQYFRDGVYAFGEAAYDHNFSQGLDLQQAYGGGIGWSVIHTANEKLDVKASMTYVAQRFQVSSNDQNLIGTTFAEGYQRTLFRGILFNEAISVTPAWNNTSAYSANGSAALAVPVYKRFALSISTLDTFLNDPPPGFKKNSFQFTTGITYTLP